MRAALFAMTTGAAIISAFLIPLGVIFYGVPLWGVLLGLFVYWAPVTFYLWYMYGGMTRSEVEDEIDEETSESASQLVADLERRRD